MVPVEYKQTPYDTIIEGDSLTEQEHTDSCDANKMLLNAARGMSVRGGAQPQYGYDDTTMDGVQFRIQKEALERELANGPKEFSEEELELIPKPIQEKFGYKVKAKTPKNDDKTTKTGDPAPTPTEPPITQPQAD